MRHCGKLDANSDPWQKGHHIEKPNGHNLMLPLAARRAAAAAGLEDAVNKNGSRKPVEPAEEGIWRKAVGQLHRLS